MLCSALLCYAMLCYAMLCYEEHFPVSISRETKQLKFNSGHHGGITLAGN